MSAHELALIEAKRLVREFRLTAEVRSEGIGGVYERCEKEIKKLVRSMPFKKLWALEELIHDKVFARRALAHHVPFGRLVGLDREHMARETVAILLISLAIEHIERRTDNRSSKRARRARMLVRS